MVVQEEERAKEHKENKPLMWVENSIKEEVEEVSQQTTKSTGLGASFATAASSAEDRTRKPEESKSLPEASEADEGLGRTSDGTEAGHNSADVVTQVEKRGGEGEENQETLHKRLEIGSDESLTTKSGEPQSKYYLNRSLYIKYSRM